MNGITSSFKTSDGEYFDNKLDAVNHQLRLTFCESLDLHLRSIGYVPGDESYNIATDVIMKDLDGLAEVLECYLIARKERDNA